MEITFYKNVQKLSKRSIFYHLGIIIIIIIIPLKEHLHIFIHKEKLTSFLLMQPVVSKLAKRIICLKIRKGKNVYDPHGACAMYIL